jgi:hypothetical protein
MPVEVTVPIYEEFCFQETFQVPIRTPLLNVVVDVPISTTIPISMQIPVDIEVPISIHEKLPLQADIPIDLTVPVAIPLAETPLPGYLEELATLLDDVLRQLPASED